MKLRRIDSELVRRGLAKSRSAAAQMIEDGRVKLDGQIVLKPARQMDPAQAIIVEESDDPEYVSRGAHKLAGALDALGDKAPLIEGRRALDAGASTGGFTDVLLRRGAASVVAVDVGYGQLAWKLQSDPRVEVHDRTNVRTLDPASVAPAPELVVGDMSFISLTLVLPALVAAAAPDADFLLMVKPQFEIGKERLGHGEWCAIPSTTWKRSKRLPDARWSWASISLPSQPRHFPALAATSSISCTCAATTPNLSPRLP